MARKIGIAALWAIVPAAAFTWFVHVAVYFVRPLTQSHTARWLLLELILVAILGFIYGYFSRRDHAAHMSLCGAVLLSMVIPILIAPRLQRIDLRILLVWLVVWGAFYIWMNKQASLKMAAFMCLPWLYASSQMYTTLGAKGFNIHRTYTQVGIATFVIWVTPLVILLAYNATHYVQRKRREYRILGTIS